MCLLMSLFYALRHPIPVERLGHFGAVIYQLRAGELVVVSRIRIR